MTKGSIAADKPIAVTLEAGKQVWWCRCGKSANQPFCDGSHKGSDFEPVPYTPKKAMTVKFCACKQTDTPPFCDGSHRNL